MTYSVLNGDIMVRKGIFWTIGEQFFIHYTIISFYRAETMDMVIPHYNNGISGKYNPSKYCGINCK